MTKLSDAMAKLAGVQKSVKGVLERPPPGGGNYPLQSFTADDVGQYFHQYPRVLAILKEELPSLYGDFFEIDIQPGTTDGRYTREQVDRLFRDIEQLFEIRANSEPAREHGTAPARRVFISHGGSPLWREVQAFIERDVGLPTLELAQEPNRGRTIPEKLGEEAARCDSAVIVMTAEDFVGDNQVRARENVIHEVGFFQGRYGRSRVCLLYEEGTNIPTNLSGLVYSPFPMGKVSACFGLLIRELRAMYGD